MTHEEALNLVCGVVKKSSNADALLWALRAATTVTGVAIPLRALQPPLRALGATICGCCSHHYGRCNTLRVLRHYFGAPQLVLLWALRSPFSALQSPLWALQLLLWVLQSPLWALQYHSGHCNNHCGRCGFPVLQHHCGLKHRQSNGSQLMS